MIINNEEFTQVKNGFKDCYYISESGKIYNAVTKHFIKANKRRQVSLVRDNEDRQLIGLNALYKKVFNKQLIIDNIENLPLEEWKAIEGTAEKYFISTEGRVKSFKLFEAALLSQVTIRNGYKAVNIYFEGCSKAKLLYIHRLVAAAFLQEEASELKEIHHIDGNPSNNKVDNLCYMTVADHRALHKAKEQQKNEIPKPKESNNT